MKKLNVIVLSFVFMLIISCSSDDSSSDDGNPTNGLCEILALENEDIFLNGPDDLYNISAIDLNGNCLQIKMIASGCDGSNWETNLVANESEFTIWPPQKEMRIAFTNNEDCEASIIKTISFDISPLQKENSSLVILYLEGWTTPIFYNY